jgi:tetratricopeptide (TPR) repeat protein
MIPTQETEQAGSLYRAGDYRGAVEQAKAALNKNEKYTPAMLIMAKAYFKVGKYEWVRTLLEMMTNANATDAEKAEMYEMVGFMEREKQNSPGAVEMFEKATVALGSNARMWNNLGAQYMEAKNYRRALPALEKAIALQPTMARAHVNLGSAHRGIKDYEKAHAEYQTALKLFPNYADAVFNLGILYLDADKMPNMDIIAKLNTGITYLQRYQQMMTSGGVPLAADPADGYIADAQKAIENEGKKIERTRKQAEAKAKREAQKAAEATEAAKAAAAAPPPPPPAAPATPGDQPLPPSQP